MNASPACYGTMFPDLTALEDNVETHGKAFSVLVERLGVVPGRRTLKPKPEAWLQCRECEAYRECYDYCMARLLLTVGLVVV